MAAPWAAGEKASKAGSQRRGSWLSQCQFVALREARRPPPRSCRFSGACPACQGDQGRATGRTALGEGLPVRSLCGLALPSGPCCANGWLLAAWHRLVVRERDARRGIMVIFCWHWGSAALAQVAGSTACLVRPLATRRPIAWCRMLTGARMCGVHHSASNTMPGTETSGAKLQCRCRPRRYPGQLGAGTHARRPRRFARRCPPIQHSYGRQPPQPSSSMPSASSSPSSSSSAEEPG